MSIDTLHLVAQLALLSGLLGWLVFGVRDNILYPEQNRGLTDLVLSMALIEEQYPQFWHQLGHRRIVDPKVQAALFRFIVGVEVLVCLVLGAGVLGLAGAIVGLIDVEAAHALGLAGALGYTMIWTGFLVAGNHFAYWLCHKEQQFTHFNMMLWGLGTMLFIVSF